MKHQRIKPSTVACRLRQARKAKGMTLDKVESLTDIPPETLSRWERGGTAPVQAAQKLSRLYKKPINWLWPEDITNG
jgi:transcriptional regulator with XRE-family HTH domain